MSIPQLSKVLTLSPTTLQDICTKVNGFEQNVKSVLDYISGKGQLDSVVLTNIKLVDGYTTQHGYQLNQIPHTLGRPLVGWSLCGLSANATVWDGQLTNNNKGIYLNLYCSADCVVSIVCF
jgi:hypothetical protein